MTIVGWLQIAVVLIAVVAAAVPLGAYMARVMAGERTLLSPDPRPRRARLLRPDGRRRAARADLARAYTLAMLAFSAAGFFSLYALAAAAGGSCR